MGDEDVENEVKGGEEEGGKWVEENMERMKKKGHKGRVSWIMGEREKDVKMVGLQEEVYWVKEEGGHKGVEWVGGRHG